MHADQPTGRQQPCLYEAPGAGRLGYLLFLPKAYERKAERWPLILFLHGVGERGGVLEQVKRNGLPALLDQRPEFPFIVVSPQCPEGTYWPQELALLLGLLDEVTARYRVDPERVYLTGLSMGGYGAWYLALHAPERFAALAPICGGGVPELAGRLRRLPTWVFHGARDTVVPIQHSQAMVRAMEAAGAPVRFTVYPEAGHDSWSMTYRNPALYEWFLAHRRAGATEEASEG